MGSLTLVRPRKSAPSRPGDGVFARARRLAGSPAVLHDWPAIGVNSVDNELAALQAALAGRYRVEHPVGQGGMGVVYLAHDLKHDRAVAIKVLRPGVATLLGPERFLREIGIAAQLSHPHIVPLHDSGDADGRLYYVMPFVAGDTLRERLDKGGRLPADQAIHIIRQVASALSHAHGRGVIHRDIKPSNILLSEGFALVADFGLARALFRVSETEDISSVGLPVGTPRYMSPEQALGDRSVDGRTDLYALARVLEEMIAEPVPPAVARAMARCLARDPADRFATPDAFIAGLGEAVPVPVARRSWKRTAIAAGLAIAGGLLLWKVTDTVVSGSREAALDTTRIAVLPFDRAAGAPEYQAELPVRSALGRWSGISLVAGVQISEALKGRPAGGIDRALAGRIAREAGAGRFLRGQIIPFGDSVQVEAVLYDSRSGSPLVEKSARLPRDLAGSDQVMTRLVDSLLFRGAMPVEGFDAPPGTASVPAMWRFIEGRKAVEAWDLAAADTGFARALEADPAFARASLWLAQVRLWQGQPAVTWRAAASQALAGGARLGPRDAALAPLIAEMSRGDVGNFCPRWLDLTSQWPRDFPVWYGSAICLGRDGGVRRDPGSPTGWSFRSSYHQAQRAWRQAFVLMPAIYRELRAGGSGSRWTAPNQVRYGSALRPDSGSFMAYPIWSDDSLAFLPRPLAEFSSGHARPPAGTREAVTRQRLAFYELATEWASADPRSIEPRETVSLALWALGNPASIDSMRAARRMTRLARDRVRLGASEVLMRVLRSVEDSAEVAGARALADSILSGTSVNLEADPWDIATLAALTGRAALAARMVRLASPRSPGTLPPALTSDALALLSFAALGGPTDSLFELEGRVADGISSGVESGRQLAARQEWLGRALAQVALDIKSSFLSDLAGTGDYLIDAQVAYATGDSATALRLLRRAAASRSGIQSSELTFEAILPEARLLASMGDRTGAIVRLDPTLSDLRHVSLQQISNPVGAALLTRAMAFRADLAQAAGDSFTARRWARTVHQLWSGSDPFLAPVVQRMQSLARGAVP
jgi:hypothetical protein